MKLQKINEEEIIELNSEQLQTKINEIKKIYKILDITSKYLIKKRIGDIIINYDIDSIIVDPSYLFDNKGFNGCYLNIRAIKSGKYYPQNITIPKLHKNAKDINLHSLQEIINNEFTPLKSFLSKRIYFDVNKLRIEYLNQTKDLQIKDLWQNTTKNEIQKLKNTIKKFTTEQLQTKIKEICETYKTLNELLQIIIEKKIEFVANYDIKTIDIRHTYKSTNKGIDFEYKIYVDDNFVDCNKRNHTEIVPKYFESAEDISFDDLGEKIYCELKSLDLPIKRNITFNVPKIRSKYIYHKLIKDINTKKSQVKISGPKI